MAFWENLGTIAAALVSLGAIIGGAYGFYTKCSKKHKRNKELKHKRNETLDSLPAKFENIDNKIDEIVQHHEDLAVDVRSLQEKNEKIMDLLDVMDTTVLRNLIWTTISGCEIHDIPDRQLRMALEGCEIYLAKGENHETGELCRRLREESIHRLTNQGGQDGK